MRVSAIGFVGAGHGAASSERVGVAELDARPGHALELAAAAAATRTCEHRRALIAAPLSAMLDPVARGGLR